jgi:hypothetical protein
MNFLSADDMDARMAVQLRKRVGFGITANMHITGMHVEGKVSFLHSLSLFFNLSMSALSTSFLNTIN